MNCRRGGPRCSAHAALVAFERSRSARIAELLDSGPPLTGRDRALAQEIALGVARRQRLLDFVLASFMPRGLPRDPSLLTALRIGAYQLLFLTRVPAHAAVDESVALAGRKSGVVNAVLRRLSGAVVARPADPARPRRALSLEGGRCLELDVDLPDANADPVRYLALLHGLPDFLVRRWRERLGPEIAARVAEAASETPGVHLRATARAQSVAALAERLAAAGVRTEASEHPRTLRVLGGSSPFQTAEFADGQFVVQDPTATAAAEAVGAQVGETVFDLCAAPGTKATLLAEAVGPGGAVFAYDLDPERRRRVSENAERLRLSQLHVIDDPGRLPGPVDRALCDVPCSNTGVLTRRVEVRHWITEADIARLARNQRELLQRTVLAVRPGGRVVYSTCSLEADENEQVVSAVAEAAGLRVVESRTTLPEPPHHDGGFFAVLEVPATPLGRETRSTPPGTSGSR